MKKIKENEVLRKAVKRIMEETQSLERGGIVTYETMQRCSGIFYGALGWRSLCVKLIKTFVRERKIVLRAVKNVGYCLLTHDEQLHDNPTYRLRKSKSQLRRCVSETEAVPDSELSTLQRSHKIASVRLAKRHRLELGRAVRISRAIRQQQTNPLNIARKPLSEMCAVVE